VHTYAARTTAVLLEDSLECPLVELGLLEEDGVTGVLRFRAGYHQSLSMPTFVYALAQFWNRVAPDRETLPFSELAFGAGSPGAVLKLDENSLTERLERLEHVTGGHFAYTDTAGIRQVYRQNRGGDCFALLDEHYAIGDPRTVVGV